MAEYLVITVYNTILLPDMELSLPATLTSDEEKRAKADGGRIVLAPVKRPVTAADLREDDLYPTALTAVITGTGVGVSGRILRLKTGAKGHISGLRRGEGILTADFSESPEQNRKVLSDEEIRQLNAASNTLNFSADQKYSLLEASDEQRDAYLAEIRERYEQSKGGRSGEGERTRQRKSRKKDYRKMVEDAGMPDDVRDEVDEVLERYESSQP